MPKKTTVVDLSKSSTPEPTPSPTADKLVTQSELVQAFVAAIEANKPVVKKTAANRTKNTPWTPKDGSPQIKMKRKMFHHGLPLASRVSTAEISLLNQIKPGLYCDGHVRVIKRRDKGLDIDYPIKTSSQRLKLVNMFGIRDFKELLQRIVDEGANPAQYKSEDDLD